MKAQEISQLVVIDYNNEGDWLDDECMGCGMLSGRHIVQCKAIEDAWKSLAETH